MVSVIVPYTEDRGYLTQCLESIKNQTYPYELIEVHSPRSVAINFNRGLSFAKG